MRATHIITVNLSISGLLLARLLVYVCPLLVWLFAWLLGWPVLRSSAGAGPKHKVAHTQLAHTPRTSYAQPGVRTAGHMYMEALSFVLGGLNKYIYITRYSMHINIEYMNVVMIQLDSTRQLARDRWAEDR